MKHRPTFRKKDYPVAEIRRYLEPGPVVLVSSAWNGPRDARVENRRAKDHVDNNLMNTPNRTPAAAFPRDAAGPVLADSAFLQWKGLLVRRYRYPRVVDRFLVIATPESR